MKKIISLLLSVCLIITILPLGSFATMVSATTEDTDANSVEVRIKEFVENYGRPLYNWLDSYNGAPTEENIDDVIFLSFYFSGIDTYAPYTYTKTEVEKIVDKHFVVDNLDLSLSSCYNAETDTYKPQSGGFGGVFVYEPTITQNEDIYNVTIPYILAGEDDITGNLFLQITEDLRIVKFCVKHSYSSDYDAKCNNCGFVRTVTDTSCYTYTISNGEATITDCDTSISGDVVIPSNLGGNPVTIIRSSAFEDCTNITSITIPDCITKIGSGAFKNCTSLERITLPFVGSSRTVADTYDGVFGYIFGYFTTTATANYGGAPSQFYVSNPYKQYHYYIPLSLKEVIITDASRIPFHAFYNCTMLTSIAIQSSITRIGSEAFYNCKNLTDITIPNGVRYISDSAFKYCISLKNIKIPDSVEEIGEQAFRGCSSIESISVPFVGSSRNAELHDDVLGYFFGYTICYADYDIPDETTKQGATSSSGARYCYYIPSSLESVKITNSTYIPEYAFDNCKNLKTVTIPANAAAIGAHAFSGCESITQMNIPYGVWSINFGAFGGCKSLISIIIPDSVIAISNYAFYDCKSLETVYYNGDEESWNGIHIGSYNTALNKAEKYFHTHAYINNCDTICDDCGHIRTITHEYDNECDTECNVCGDVRSITHTFDNACDTECNVCGSERTTTHIYSTICDTNCNICGYVRTVPDHSYTLNSNHTCDICRYSKTPVAPIVESKTNNSVTLLQTEGFEYSKDGTTWQISNVFSNLSANTTYTFYQRVKASTTALVSEVSEGTVVTFKSTQTSVPSAPIISSFTDTTVTLIPNTNYEYSIDGTTWQTSNVFTGLSAGTKYTFYQRYAETDTHEASNKSSGTSVTTDKSKQTLIPNAPTVQSFTSSSITLVSVDGCEYSKDGTTWQTSNVFSSLSCGTEYTFYQRYKETTTTYVGKSSVGFTAKTDKGTQSAPSAPTLLSKTHNSVTLTAVSGYEYSRDGVNWQTSNVFTGLNAETNYMFYQRKAETTTHYESASSTALTVKTTDEPVYTVVFKDWDGSVISTKTYHYGDNVIIPTTPTRPNDDKYSYTFKGWDKTVTNCNGNAVYTATYTATSLVPNKVTSTKFTITGDNISKITAGTTVSSLLSGLNEGTYCKVYKGGTQVSGTTAVGTGMVVNIMDGSTVKATYTIIVTGDTNGDGDITITDMVAIKSHVLGKTTLTGVYATAADTSGDGGISLTDFIQVKAKILGKGTITAR